MSLSLVLVLVLLLVLVLVVPLLMLLQFHLLFGLQPQSARCRPEVLAPRSQVGFEAYPPFVGTSPCCPQVARLAAQGAIEYCLFACRSFCRGLHAFCKSSPLADVFHKLLGKNATQGRGATIPGADSASIVYLSLLYLPPHQPKCLHVDACSMFWGIEDKQPARRSRSQPPKTGLVS